MQFEYDFNLDPYVRFIQSLDILDSDEEKKLLQNHYRKIMKEFADNAKSKIDSETIKKAVGVKKLRQGIAVVGGGIYTQSPLVNIIFNAKNEDRVITATETKRIPILEKGYLKGFYSVSAGQSYNVGPLEANTAIRDTIRSDYARIVKESTLLTEEQVKKKAKKIANRLGIRLA